LSHIVYAVGAAPYQSALSTDGLEVAAERGIDTAGRTGRDRGRVHVHARLTHSHGGGHAMLQPPRAVPLL